MGPLIDAGGRKPIGDDQRRAGGETVDDATVVPDAWPKTKEIGVAERARALLPG